MAVRVSVAALLVLLATACSRSGDSGSSDGGAPRSGPAADGGPIPWRDPPKLDGGGDDVLVGSPTASLDEKVFDALRRDRPAEVDAISVRPLSRVKLDSLRGSLLGGAATFRRSVANEAGLEIVYTVLEGTHELHLVYETRGATRLADAWIFGW